MLDGSKGKRGGWRRTWLKFYPYEALHGSLRYQLDSAERGVWWDLWGWSGLCINFGTISDNDGRAYPLSFIANRLNITEELLKRTLEKCELEGRIKEDEHGIHVTNMLTYQSKFQSEYDRQKKYRHPKKSEGKPNKIKGLEVEK